MYPPTTIQVLPYHSVRSADLLTNEEIAHAHVGFVVSGVAGTYSKFIRTYLQGCLVGISVFLFPF